MDYCFAERIHSLNTQYSESEKKAMKCTYTPYELETILGISLSRVYVLLKEAPFEVFKAGQHYYISKDSFEMWYTGQRKGVAEHGD